MSFDERAYQRAIMDSELPPTARLVAFALSRFESNEGGRCFPSFAEIGRVSGLSRTAVAKALDVLEDAFWIRRIKRSDGRGHRSSNLFVLRVPHGEQERAAVAREARRAARTPRIAPADEPKVREAYSGGVAPEDRGEMAPKGNEAHPPSASDDLPQAATRPTPGRDANGGSALSGQVSASEETTNEERRVTEGADGNARAHAHPSEDPPPFAHTDSQGRKSAWESQNWNAVKSAYRKLREKFCDSSVVDPISAEDKQTILESILGVHDLADEEIDEAIEAAGFSPPVASSGGVEAVAESMLSWWFDNGSDYLREKRYPLRSLAGDIGAVEGDFREFGLQKFVEVNVAAYVERQKSFARPPKPTPPVVSPAAAARPAPTLADAAQELRALTSKLPEAKGRPAKTEPKVDVAVRALEAGGIDF